ncbi:MAG: LemA family protein [Gemmatimonadota bacterium]|nr:LemA family protein [Gemmatimonadota bacterium]
MKQIRYMFITALLITTSSCGYNRIQTLDENVNGFQSQIEVQLQRRADLIPNLVEVVKSFAEHETEVFTAVADARSRLNGAVASGNLGDMAEADVQMTGALGRLLAISEAYPDLRSNENFRTLQDQLEGTENRIATARADYNNAVREYNGYIRRFPAVLTAKAIGVGARDYFEADEAAAEAPRVEM